MKLENILKDWTIHHLVEDNPAIIKDLWDKEQPKVIATDTETDGLNYLHSTPFLIIFGYVTKGVKRVFTFKRTFSKTLELYNELCHSPQITHHFFWNAVYDNCMLLNIGIDLTDTKIADGQAILRLISDASDSFERKALKKVAVKHLAEDADSYEKELKEYLKKLNRDRSTVIRKSFNVVDSTGEAWDYSKYNRYLKDIELGEAAIPEEVQEVMNGIIEEMPEPNYTNVPEELLLKYAALDVILTLEFVLKYFPVIASPQSSLYQLNIFETECAILPAVIQQVREGVLIDMDYLLKSKTKVQEKISFHRKRLHTLLGKKINVGQNMELAKWFELQGYQYEVVKKVNTKGQTVEVKEYKADKDFLIKVTDKLNKKLAQNNLLPAQVEKANLILDVCKTVTFLRTLEKWYSTYIIKLINNVEKYKDGKYHAMYDPYGAVSGRFSGDFQQFPRDAVYDTNGEEIFYPRKAIIAPEGYSMAYFDYSQIELRLGAHSTVVAGNPDKLLLKSYVNLDNDPDWIPTDMHLATAVSAFSIPEDKVKLYQAFAKDETAFHKTATPEQMKIIKEVKAKRSLSKVPNFAFLYCGTAYTVNKSVFLGNDMHTSELLEKSFKDTFPGVIAYQKWAADQVLSVGRVVNDLGRIYRFTKTDNKSRREASNYRIQGSGADYLKARMAEVWKFLKENKLQTKIIGNIHDEIQFLVPNNEMHILKNIKQIMEAGAEWSSVPIIVDVEVSTTNWAQKEGVNL